MSIRKGNLVLAAKGVIKAEAKSYVVDNTVATEFDSMADTITLTSDFVDYNGNTITLAQLNVGDNVIVKQLNVPDRYVLSKTSSSVIFGTLETSKIVIPTTVDGMTGGTITAASGDTAVRFKSKSTSSRAGFIDTNNNVLGFLGVNSSKKPVFYDSSEHQLALLSDIPTIPTITTATGSESISDGTNTLNVVTRDTAQTISGIKEFSNPIVLPASNNPVDINSITFNTGNSSVAKIGASFNGLVTFTSVINESVNSTTPLPSFIFQTGQNGRLKLYNDAIVPMVTNQYSLGTSSIQFNNIYGKTVYQNGKQVANAEDVPSITSTDVTITEVD